MSFWLKLMFTGCIVGVFSFFGLIVNDDNSEVIGNICAGLLILAGIAILIGSIIGIWVDL